MAQDLYQHIRNEIKRKRRELKELPGAENLSAYAGPLTLHPRTPFLPEDLRQAQAKEIAQASQPTYTSSGPLIEYRK